MEEEGRIGRTQGRGKNGRREEWEGGGEEEGWEEGRIGRNTREREE